MEKHKLTEHSDPERIDAALDQFIVALYLNGGALQEARTAYYAV